MSANRFTAVIDACVLADVARRDLLLSLAEAGLVRLRWSNRILSETEKAIAAILSDRADANERASASIRAMKTAFPDALEDEHADILKDLDCLPDTDDHHVLAIAIGCKASLIVTENLKDFPREALLPYDLDVKSSDAFLADAIDLDYPRAIQAVRHLRERLRNRAFSIDALFEIWRRRGMNETVNVLYPHARHL